MATVIYCDELFDEFVSSLNSKSPNLTDRILKDFERYVSSDFEEVPRYFGRDTYYGWPKEIAGIVGHIHLCIPPDEFPDIPQSHRVCKKKNGAEKDIALLYVQGIENLESYCILAILMPNAHEKAKNNALMLRIARYARAFRYNN